MSSSIDDVTIRKAHCSDAAVIVRLVRPVVLAQTMVDDTVQPRDHDGYDCVVLTILLLLGIPIRSVHIGMDLDWMRLKAQRTLILQCLLEPSREPHRKVLFSVYRARRRYTDTSIIGMLRQ